MIKSQSVVFFLGAGFSAPFGLPVMSNFIDKARDLYFSDPDNYKSVGKTLELITKYSSVKNYLNINLHNIEDLLSIAYMESAITKESSSMELVTDFIKVVIENYTGQVTNESRDFAELVANVSLKKTGSSASYRVQGRDHYAFLCDGKRFENTGFGIVSLNYDLVIEKALADIASTAGKFYEITNRPNEIAKYFAASNVRSETGVPMAKLHGSLDKTIIPPTWNKDVNEEIYNDWILASELLKNATHIIFLGYSLPSTDNYIKYLLANSLSDNQRLKRISVITKDADGQTGIRYKSLFDSYLTVHNIDILKFFEVIENVETEIDFDEFDEIFSNFYSS
jgi:hypothetical protein